MDSLYGSLWYGGQCHKFSRLNFVQKDGGRWTHPFESESHPGYLGEFQHSWPSRNVIFISYSSQDGERVPIDPSIFQSWPSQVALLLRKSLKAFPQGALENLNWGAVLTLLGLFLALTQTPEVVTLLQSNVIRFFA